MHLINTGDPVIGSMDEIVTIVPDNPPGPSALTTSSLAVTAGPTDCIAISSAYAPVDESASRQSHGISRPTAYKTDQHDIAEPSCRPSLRQGYLRH